MLQFHVYIVNGDLDAYHALKDAGFPGLVGPDVDSKGREAEAGSRVVDVTVDATSENNASAQVMARLPADRDYTIRVKRFRY